MEEYAGKICPVCKQEIKSFEKVKICSECGIPHHLKCWENNSGCSTFGCGQQGICKKTVTTSPQDNNVGLMSVSNGHQNNTNQYYDNEPPFFGKIGKKLKMFAQVMFQIQAIGCIFGGIDIEVESWHAWENVVGWILILAGPIVTWISMWFIYGFGELIDKISDIEKNTRGGISVSVTQPGIK